MVPGELNIFSYDKEIYCRVSRLVITSSITTVLEAHCEFRPDLLIMISLIKCLITNFAGISLPYQPVARGDGEFKVVYKLRLIGESLQIRD